MTPENLHPDFIYTRTFAAPRSAVYAAWAEAERVAQWTVFGNAIRTYKRFELHPGGALHSVHRSADGQESWDFCTVEEVVPGERLVYVQSFSDAEGGIAPHPLSATWPLRLRTTLTFEDAGEDKTNLTIRWQPVDATPEEQQTFDAAHDAVRGGWDMMLGTLDNYLARQQPQPNTTAEQ